MLTEKGYWKKKLRLLRSMLNKEDLSQIEQLETDVKEEIITEVRTL